MRDFTSAFGRPPTHEASAPGRVNLIGEHTDYQEGYVLPIALPQRTHVSLALRPDGRVRAVSANIAGPAGHAEFSLGAEQRGRGWVDYVQGVTFALAERGHRLGGVDLHIQSDVPVGGGLSSSAALEVAVLRALRDAFDLEIDDVEVARVAHRAETGFVGAPVGMMDPMASSLADADRALFLDTRTLAYDKVPLPAGVELALIDSGVTHAHASGEYRVRRAETERAAALLGVPTLRDASADDPRLARLPPPLDRRARHVVTENARVLAAVAAMKAGDAATLGRLLNTAHASLAEDFEASAPAVDSLVALAQHHPDVLGARMTGGGWGGAVLLLCRRGTAAEVAGRVYREYRSETGREGGILLPATFGAGHGS
jgi:galactokinase